MVEEQQPEEPIQKSEEEWKEQLTPEQYQLLREKGTEMAFIGKYYDHHEDGSYHCAACGNALFSSAAKFDSGSGWPSFDDPMNAENVLLVEDRSLGMLRTEVLCKNCGSHLGHLFDDGPAGTTGKRFCINSACLAFEKKDPELPK